MPKGRKKDEMTITKTTQTTTSLELVCDTAELNAIRYAAQFAVDNAPAGTLTAEQSTALSDLVASI
jgi:hypothetical protein